MGRAPTVVPEDLWSEISWVVVVSSLSALSVFSVVDDVISCDEEEDDSSDDVSKVVEYILFSKENQ